MAGVANTNSSNIADADGVSTVFNFTFFAYSVDTVKAYSVLNDVLTPITTGITKVINSSFIGGTVTFAVAPADAVGKILIRREVPNTQTTEFADLTRLKETAIEAALNTIVLQVQQLQEGVSRSLKYTEASGVSDPTLETPTDTAALIFDGITGRVIAGQLASLVENVDTVFSGLAAGDLLQYNGSVFVNKTVDEILDAYGISAFVKTLLDDADEDEFRDSINAAESGVNSDITTLQACTAITGLTSDITTLVASATANLNLKSTLNTGDPGAVNFYGRDDAAAEELYAQIIATITANTAGAEAGKLKLMTKIAGALASRFEVGNGLFASGLSDMGAQTVNALAYYVSGVALQRGLDVLASGSVSSGTTVDFTNLDEANYRTMILLLTEFNGNGSAGELAVRYSDNNGSGYTDFDTGAGFAYTATSPVTIAQFANLTATTVAPSGAVDGAPFGGIIILTGLGVSTKPMALSLMDHAGKFSISAWGRSAAALTIDAFRIALSAGAFTAGKYILYGLRN